VGDLAGTGVGGVLLPGPRAAAAPLVVAISRCGNEVGGISDGTAAVSRPALPGCRHPAVHRADASVGGGGGGPQSHPTSARDLAVRAFWSGGSGSVPLSDSSSPASPSGTAPDPGLGTPAELDVA
jgi:hypothetical protein